MRWSTQAHNGRDYLAPPCAIPNRSATDNARSLDGSQGAMVRELLRCCSGTRKLLGFGVAENSPAPLVYISGAGLRACRNVKNSSRVAVSRSGVEQVFLLGLRKS